MLSVLEKQFAKDGVKIDRCFSPDLPPVLLDEGKIQQVWMNLLLNAKQAIRNGDGIIAVTTQLDKARGWFGVDRGQR